MSLKYRMFWTAAKKANPISARPPFYIWKTLLPILKLNSSTRMLKNAKLQFTTKTENKCLLEEGERICLRISTQSHNTKRGRAPYQGSVWSFSERQWCCLSRAVYRGINSISTEQGHSLLHATFSVVCGLYQVVNKLKCFMTAEVRTLRPFQALLLWCFYLLCSFPFFLLPFSIAVVHWSLTLSFSKGKYLQ